MKKLLFSLIIYFSWTAFFNTAGQVVAEFVEGDKTPGAHSVNWNGCNRAGAPVASGIYYYQIQAGELQKIGKMTLLK